MAPRSLLSTLFMFILMADYFPHHATARTLYPRVEPRKLMEEQVYDVVQYLSDDPESKIESPSTSAQSINDKLLARLESSPIKKRRLKIFFIEFVGSFGDIGKSAYYLETLLEEQCSKFTYFLSAMFDKKLTKVFDIHFVADCRCNEFLPKDIKSKFKKDLKTCGDTVSEFQKAVERGMTNHRPDIIIRGHPVERLYNAENRNMYESLRNPIDVCIKEDQCILIDIKSFWVDPKTIEEDWTEYKMNKNELTIVGQTPDYYDNMKPRDSKQVLVGRAPTPQSGGLPKKLVKWLKDGRQDRIMYLGHGGNIRKGESTLNNPTRALEKFVSNRLNEPEGDDWSFILFHNAKRSEEDVKKQKTPITHCNRVYHVWYPTDLLKLWSHPKIEIILHHCGKGSFDDSLIAEKAQICMPQNGFGKDMFHWEKMLEHYEIGESVPPITFKQHGKEVVGEEDYDGEAELLKSFRKVVRGVERKSYSQAIKDRRNILVTDTAAELTIELVKRLALGLWERNPQKQ